MYLLYIVDCDFLSCRPVIGGQKDDHSLDRVDLAHLARVLLIRTAGFARIGGEVEKRDFRVLAGAYSLVVSF